jgi:iron complex outermembrane receptor protein
MYFSRLRPLRRHSLLASAAALALSAVALPALAADAADDATLSEVIITAEKRETNLQKTPVAASVLGAEQLADRRIQSLADLTTGIPSLRVAPFFSRSSALTVGIRGIVPFDANQPSRDAGVGVYIDGVYLGRSQGLGATLYDIERIEVLKGPQGALFGRNSTGGAVSIVSRKPSGELGLRQSVGVRNFGGYSAETHLDLPEWNNLAVKVDGIVSKRDGTTDNPMEGQSDFNAIDRSGIHVGVLWSPTDDFEARLDFDEAYDGTTPYYVQLLSKTPTSPALAPLVQVQSDRAKVADIGVPQEDSVGRTQGWALHLSWSPLEDLEVRTISAYRRLKQSQYDNGIGAHAGVFVPNGQFARYSLASLRQDQVSHELQALGSLGDLTYVVGAYYYHEEGDDDAWTPNTLQWNATGTAATRLPSLIAGARWPFPDRASTARATSTAIFGQATWIPSALDGRLRLTAGGRFTHDEKSGDLTRVNGAVTALSFTFEDERFDPSVSALFDLTETTSVYAKWGTAYRAGGANSRSVSYRAFGPEEVATTEAGIKSEFWDRRARLNIAAFTTLYTDIQIDFSAVNLNNSNRGTLETVNAPGEGRIEGLEVDFTIAPVTGLTLAANYAFTTSNLPVAANPFAGGRLQPVYIVYTPKNALSASIDYVRPIGDMTLRAHLDANFADGYRGSSGEATFSDSSKVWNGRLALTDIRITDSVRMEASLWSRNLFDDAYVFYRSAGAAAAQGVFGMFNEPQTYGLDLTFRY